MQTAFYIRFSREEARGEQSLETMIDNRVAQCFQICDIHKFPHPKAEHIFVEIASGGSIAKRPKIQRLLEMCAAGEVSRLVTTNVDRLSRGDLTDQGLVERSLTQGNVTLATWAGIEVYDDNRVSLSTDVLLAAARYLRQDAIKKRKQADAQRFTENKKRGGNAAFGYKRLGIIDGHDCYEPVEPGFSIVKEAIGRLRNGETGYQIAKDFNERGLVRKQGGKWDSDSVISLGRNPFYAGYHGWRTEVKNGKRIRYDRRRPENMRLPEEAGTWQTILSLDEWRSLQARLGAIQRKGPRGKGLLTNILHCPLGSPMHIRSEVTYGCKHVQELPRHPGSQVSFGKMNAWILEWVGQVIQRIDVDALPTLPDNKHDAESAYSSAMKQLSVMQARVEKLKADYQFLVDVWGQEHYRSAYNEACDQLAASEKVAENAKRAAAMSGRVDVLPALRLFKEGKLSLQDYSPDQQKKIVGALIERIDLLPPHPGKKIIHAAVVTWYEEWQPWVGEPPRLMQTPGNQKRKPDGRF